MDGIQNCKTGWGGKGKEKDKTKQSEVWALRHPSSKSLERQEKNSKVAEGERSVK